jgi:glutamate carboxypeptidase
MTDLIDVAPDLIAHLTRMLGPMLNAIGTLVSHETPTGNKAALDELASFLAAQYRALGGSVARVRNRDGGDHLHIRHGLPDDPEPPVLVLGHFDTVWPIGTLAHRPFRVVGNRASGPGIFDMKAGLVLFQFALAGCRLRGLPFPRPIELLLTSDEEIGSPTSRRLVEEAAGRAAHVLVLEPPLPGGALKTARKGVGRFTLDVTGRAAHAGVDPSSGVSAIVELAHQVLAIGELADPAAGSTLSVGLIQGGTAPNVVPASARAVIDARASTRAEVQRLEMAMAALGPMLPGAKLAVTGGFNRPPMERTPAIAALFAKAKKVGQVLGLELTEGATGGGSDGNFTAALGVPTLDGLGAPGGGAHADDEHILVDALPARAALLAGLLLSL